MSLPHRFLSVRFCTSIYPSVPLHKMNEEIKKTKRNRKEEAKKKSDKVESEEEEEARTKKKKREAGINCGLPVLSEKNVFLQRCHIFTLKTCFIFFFYLKKYSFLYSMPIAQCQRIAAHVPIAERKYFVTISITVLIQEH